MGLFGAFNNNDNKPSKTTLKSLIEDRFSDLKLIKVLEEYLASRKELKNLPSKIAWEKQLDLLKHIPTDADRIAQVETATMRGWRQIVFNETLDKYKKTNISRSSREEKERAKMEMSKRDEVF